jgi:hypothetical protein
MVGWRNLAAQLSLSAKNSLRDSACRVALIVEGNSQERLPNPAKPDETPRVGCVRPARRARGQVGQKTTVEKGPEQSS